ncbi:MAG: ABC transporter permease [Candidatus Cellulosilyticum pullistercoris]|uniref:ABC transporter permease n=1 Tax=Candidatus Cellulosilyticum pullistercoris TaxID=2838521 RepID=A0A9E2K961_9FIRM|nr:ABC transporter permease [Candidatus Cellulosilyticum pullistercoris]
MMTYLKSLGKEISDSTKKLGILILLFVGFPFLSMWFAGAYYCEYVDDVAIAVLDEDNSSLSRQIIQYFDDNERFTVAYQVSDRKALQELIDERKVYMGLYIPDHLNDDIKAGIQSQVLILTDGTNVIIGNNIYAGAASIVQSVSAGASIQVLEGKGEMLEDMANNTALTFGFEERMLYDSKMTYMNYLIYGVMTVFLQQLMLSSMATMLSRNPEEVAKEHTLAQIAAKITLSGGILITSASFSVFLIHKKFNLIYNGSIFVALLMSILFAIAISVPGILLFSVTKKKTRFTQVAYMLSLPTFLTCGYVWPVDQMPPLLANIVRVIWPLMNYSRAFDEVMIKGLPLDVVKGNILGLLLYIMVGMPLAIYVFKKSFNSDLATSVARDIPATGEINM